MDELSAREIVDAALAAWSKGEIDSMLRAYDDDIVYWCNAGGRDGSPLTITGIAALREFLVSVSTVLESVCASEYFRLIDGVGRTRIEAYVRHKQTGHTLVGTFRQEITFRNGKILRVDEYHDAAKMAAFWRLIAGEPAPVAESSSDAKIASDL